MDRLYDLWTWIKGAFIVLFALWFAVFVSINLIRYAPVETATIAGSAAVIGIAAWRWPVVRRTLVGILRLAWWVVAAAVVMGIFAMSRPDGPKCETAAACESYEPPEYVPGEGGW